mmetsp:Transcript_21945/g.52233  ORF Transcript_21945/g.52233 Transcript_21945/m.52233 type:complete len:124 (+) Transcript_21945:2-373(+)
MDLTFVLILQSLLGHKYPFEKTMHENKPDNTEWFQNWKSRVGWQKEKTKIIMNGDLQTTTGRMDLWNCNWHSMAKLAGNFTFCCNISFLISIGCMVSLHVPMHHDCQLFCAFDWPHCNHSRTC